MTGKLIVIRGSYSPANLRSPYADSRKTRNPTIHAVALNRSGNQSTRLAAPKTRSQRALYAAEATNTTPRPYDYLPWRVDS